MTPERWQRVKEVLHGALEIAPEQRPAFLDEACSGDQALRGDVESLLASSDEARSSFLASTAARVTLAKGTRLGDYEVQLLIGAGGMGEVYRARDCRLDRDVAIKVLPSFLSSDPDRLRRFEQEARAAAALNHPNILAVFQMGTYEGSPYLVSELLEGLTLREHFRRGPLPRRKAIDYAIQIADGLAAAHDKGIVHRDLKPENLFATKDGRIKILDFGLAKLTQPTPGPPDATRTLDHTEPGMIMGTVGYMAPEQVRGERADHRADIFAFGAILYEMVSGKRAFQGASAVEIMGAILKAEPPEFSASVSAPPPGLQRIAYRCLEKNPDQRFQTASDLAFALESLSESLVGQLSKIRLTPHSQGWPRTIAAAVTLAVIVATAVISLQVNSIRDLLFGSKPQRIQSLAVLPLENLSRDPEQEYFANGMTEALITSLAKAGNLRVISRTSVIPYKNSTKPLPRIAQELGVDAVVEGSVLESGNRVRITAQLIEAQTDRHVWAESYERDLRDILSLQDDVAVAITSAIAGKVEASQAISKREVDPDAYRSYLKGVYYWDKRTADGIQKSIELFNQAIAKDPTFALAYSALAGDYVGLAGFSLASTRDVLPKARTAVLRALELDDSLSAAHETRATIQMIEWQFHDAEPEFQKALRLDPSNAGAHQGYGAFLARLGRFDEASAELRKATELDPLWLAHGVELGKVYYYQGHYDEAINEFNKVLEMNPDFWLARGYRAFAYEEQRRYQDAESDLQKVLIVFHHTNATAALGELYARWGKKNEARRIARELEQGAKKEYVSDYWLATIYSALGDQDSVFRTLENSYAEQSLWLIDLKVDPRFAGWRSNPRFQDLLKRIGLAE